MRRDSSLSPCHPNKLLSLQPQIHFDGTLNLPLSPHNDALAIAYHMPSAKTRNPKLLSVGKSGRHTNPLNPSYSIASAKQSPAPPPKFIRDAMDVSDITGARPATVGSGLRRVYASFPSFHPFRISDPGGCLPVWSYRRDISWGS